jgi:DNA-binding NarL/FixJ family response regulator
VCDRRRVATAPISVLVADTHAVVARGVGTLLDRQPDIEVGRQVTSAGAAIAYIIRHRPTVAVLDYQLDDGSGIDAAAEVTAQWAGTRCLLTSSEVSRELVAAAFDAGCRGVVPKHADAAVLLNGVRAVARGETYIPSELRVLLANDSPPPAAQVVLSERQQQVLQLMAVGASVEEIGDRLLLSAHTVRNHLRHARARLNAKSKLDAVIVAARAGLISLHAPRPAASSEPDPGPFAVGCPSTAVDGTVDESEAPA